MTIAEANALSRDGFVDLLGGVFEHSPWVAERAWRNRPFANVHELLEAMTGEVDRASRDEQLALICAHPDLGTRARVSDSSEREQASAGLNQLTPSEYGELSRLNAAYLTKFGFPFLFAVKGRDKGMILAALHARLTNDQADEFAEALRQIHRIAQFRLQTIFEESI